MDTSDTSRSCHRTLLTLALLGAICVPAKGQGQPHISPLWELGAGATVLTFPDYRGSDQTRTHVLPIPYFVYRGELFKADRNGIRGVLFNRANVEITGSVGASFPAYSNDNNARRGMPDLKSTVEFGPAADIKLWESPAAVMKLTLRLPLRAAVTVERSPEYIGFVFSPRLNLDIGNVWALPGWNLGLYVSPAYADRRFHQHFYSVASRFATADRPAYEANAGYNGTELLAALSKRYDRFWVGAFARYDTLHGAAFDASPLVRTRGYAAGGIAVAWIFAESGEYVRRD